MGKEEWLKLRRTITAHYFDGHGRSVCGRVEVGLYEKTFKPTEQTLLCKNCQVVLNMRKNKQPQGA